MPAIIPADVYREIERLRKQEAREDVLCTAHQRRCNWMAWLYPHVRIDQDLSDAPYKAMHPDLGWRRGREGMVPSRENLENPVWVEFVVSMATADAIVARDGGANATVVSSVHH